MQFWFDEEAAVQAAAHLLEKSGGRHDMYCLIKMLYLADRDMFLRWGISITGANPVRMPHGPVPSEVYDAVQGKRSGAVWSSRIRREDNTLVLLSAPGSDHLSKAAVQILDEIYAQCSRLEFAMMRRLAHGLPEHCHGTGSSIDPAEILRHEGIVPERIRQIEEDIELFNAMRAEMAMAD